MSGVLARVDPDGKELRIKVSLLRGVVVEHASVQWVGEIPMFIEESLWRVCVSVDDDGGVVDCDWVGLIGHGRFSRCLVGLVTTMQRHCTGHNQTLVIMNALLMSGTMRLYQAKSTISANVSTCPSDGVLQ